MGKHTDRQTHTNYTHSHTQKATSGTVILQQFGRSKSWVFSIRRPHIRYQCLLGHISNQISGNKSIPIAILKSKMLTIFHLPPNTLFKLNYLIASLSQVATQMVHGQALMQF